MSKKTIPFFLATLAATTVLRFARDSRASECQPLVQETVITEEPYAAISGLAVAQGGDTVAVRLTYQLYSSEGCEQAREQLFLAVEQSIVATVYDGSPGLCPGAVSDWSNASIKIVDMGPGPHPLYAVHTAADSQAAGLDGYEHDGIGWRIEIGVFIAPEIATDPIHPNRQTMPPRSETACPPSSGGDADGDSVCENQDACPDSDVRPTIIIQDCDCLVPNQLVGAGCTMADGIDALLAEAREAKEFAKGVSRLATSWERAGVINKAERKRIESCSKKAVFPTHEPDKPAPAAPEPDEPMEPEQTEPPPEPQVDKPTPAYHGDVDEKEQTGNDPGSESAGQADRITGFESTSGSEQPPEASCGDGLIPATLLGLAFIVWGWADRRSESLAGQGSSRFSAPSR